MQRSNLIRSSIVALSALGLVLVGGPAGAITRTMTGSLGVINPSQASPFFFEGGPGIFGQDIGPYPNTRGGRIVTAAGATTSTFVGRTVTIGSNLLNFSGTQFRDFPAFPTVGNQTKTFMSVQQAATFMNNQGALANCPGNGCTSGVTTTTPTPAPGLGPYIEWCPPLAHNPASPAPGTVGAQIGNWNCANYTQGARQLRISIFNTSGRPNYGGTMSVLRNANSNVWRVLVQPGMMGTPAQVERSWMELTNFAWTPGRPNFQFTPNPGNNGPVIIAQLNANGAVTQTSGCVNTGGTPTPSVGQPFVQGGLPIIGPGVNCGTDPGVDQPGLGWGFKMSTGTISGSDFYPFLNATTVSGTPLAPNFVPGGFGDGFFFTRMGTDMVTGTNRNIVLLGGGVAGDPDSTNNFFRIKDLRMTLNTPEPAMGLGLVAGAGALIALGRRRRRD